MKERAYGYFLYTDYLNALGVATSPLQMGLSLLRSWQLISLPAAPIGSTLCGDPGKGERCTFSRSPGHALSPMM